MNTLVLREIAPEEVTLAIDGADLIVGVRGSDDQVRIIGGDTEPESFTTLQFCGGPGFDRDAVLAAARNQAPVTQQDMAEVQEDEQIEAVGNVMDNDWDVEGDPIVVTNPGVYLGNYGTLTLDADGSYTYALDNGNSHIQTLAEGAETWDSFSYAVSDDRVLNRREATSFLDIRIAGTNDIPALVAPLADQGTNAGAAWSWQVPDNAFTDIDVGDELSYSATLADGSALPSWLSFDAATRTFSGTAPGSTSTSGSGKCGGSGGTATSTLDITVIATDSHGADSKATDTFRLTITGSSTGGGDDDDHHHGGHHGGHHNGGDDHHDGHGDHDDHHGQHGSHGGKDRDCFDFDRAWQLCEDFDRRHGKSACGGKGNDYRGGCDDDYAERWNAMDRKLTTHLSRDNGQSAWLDERSGADLGALGKHFSVGSGAQAFGRDSFSLACGGTKLSGFKGLQEGIGRLG